MATDESTNHITRAERMELARAANVLVSGYSEELMRIVRDRHVDSNADTHRAVLGMLATISELSNDTFGLIFGDPDDEVTRQDAEKIGRKLGLEWSDIAGAEVNHV
jgi:hypothetical protein